MKKKNYKKHSILKHRIIVVYNIYTCASLTYEINIKNTLKQLEINKNFLVFYTPVKIKNYKCCSEKHLKTPQEQALHL